MGTGTTLLLAERGPAGPQGERGAEGPPGKSAEEALLRTEDLDWRLDQIEADIATVTGLISEFEFRPPAVLAGELKELQHAAQEFCVAYELEC
ncbi:MAG TPA: hypothetical protein VFZ41_02330 [Solirubrobacterales bacterium]